MKRKLLLLMAAMMTAIMLAACGSDDEGTASEGNNSKDDVFKVGMEAGYPPFNWTQKDDSNGAVKIQGSKEYAGGYDVEIAKKIAEGLGKELVIVKTEWDGLVPSLQSGAVDAIIAGMSPTEERKEAIDFTENYYTSDFVIVVKKGGAYDKATKLTDFKGAKITAQLNTTNYKVIDQIPGVNQQVAMDNFPAMRVALQSGAIDGYVAERPEAISATAAIDGFAYNELEDGFKTDPADTAVAIGIRKDEKNSDKMNEILSNISEDERQKMMEAAISNQPAAQ
ncbi:transporter substrate-binding domain-containing protein [Lysinibacillus odysseyi]|uniref:ABC transporter substrate-binding protein n=1 Tax=Lysinibacillus odysseyi 34hs-1 = NBRC 100172 TaxID=1220589 RepID=A0A0A3IAV5_9BACI|nr:transporter substrate-binding domain-containing protein [Lysinibacillus odysseyi]KGR81829.1 ABC transporter substrate-binding protein [Lysinibacillus odysseyi 34hs-1 = NBRC 100172]